MRVRCWPDIWVRLYGTIYCLVVKVENKVGQEVKRKQNQRKEKLSRTLAYNHHISIEQNKRHEQSVNQVGRIAGVVLHKLNQGQETTRGVCKRQFLSGSKNCKLRTKTAMRLHIRNRDA